MSSVFRKVLAATFAIATGVIMTILAVEQHRWKRRRDKQAENLSTLLGTAYPHGHDSKKNF